MVTSHELDYFDLGVSMEAVARGMQHLLETGNFLKILSAMGKAAEEFAREAARNGLEGCRNADVIISGTSSLRREIGEHGSTSLATGSWSHRPLGSPARPARISRGQSGAHLHRFWQHGKQGS